MAKKGGVNKSAAIREIFQRNPKAKGSQVREELAAKGINVTSTLVYLVKAKMRMARRRQRREKVAQATGGGNPVELIRRIKSVASEVGGFDKLRQLIDLLTS